MDDLIDVRIKYLSSFRDLTGRRSERVRLAQGATLQQVADWLNKRYGLCLPDPSVMAVLNGHGWAQLPLQLATEVHEGDIICLFPPVSGG